MPTAEERDQAMAGPPDERSDADRKREEAMHAFKMAETAEQLVALSHKFNIRAEADDPPKMGSQVLPRLDWSELGGILDQTGQDMLSVLKPFLPALARVPMDVYQGFLSHLGNNDWDGITLLMFKHMNTAEREQLENSVYKNLVAATQAQYDDRELLKKVMVQIAIGLATKVLTGGIL